MPAMIYKPEGISTEAHLGTDTIASSTELAAEIAQSPTPFGDYLRMYENKKTRENYRLSVATYLTCIYPEMTSRLHPDVEIYVTRYLTELKNGRKFSTDIRTVGTALSEQFSPTTANLYLRCAWMWLEDCGYCLSRRERQRILATMPPSRAATREMEIRRKIFRDMYFELPEWPATLLIVLLGSGMRIGEAMQLLRTDIDYSGPRTAIHIRAEITKTKTARTTYLTTEATNALLDYLRARRHYADPRIFPYSPLTAQYHFRNAADRLGYGQKDPKTKCRKLHWHMTRKWFITRFALAASKDIAEHLAGHEGYLSRSYQRYTEKQILKQFKKAEQEISILR